jgi:hypothetical protein
MPRLSVPISLLAPYSALMATSRPPRANRHISGPYTMVKAGFRRRYFADCCRSPTVRAWPRRRAAGAGRSLPPWRDSCGRVRAACPRPLDEAC